MGCASPAASAKSLYENGRLNRRASSAHTQSQGRNISMTGELLYKSFHSSAGHFRGYGTILVTDEFITYSVMFKPEQVIKITLWNVLHVDCPTWVARQGFEAVKNYPLIIISFMDTDSGLEKEVVFDVPNQVERDKLIQILTELAKPFETGFESNIPGLMTRKKSLSVRDIL